MATYSYIILKDDYNGDGYYYTGLRFRVMYEGYATPLEKSGNIAKCLDGKMDRSTGGIYERHEYVIRVRETEPDGDYGSMADLEYLFRLNNPNGIPSDKLILTDHYGDELDVWFTEFNRSALTTIIEGDSAYFDIRCIFQVIPGS